MNGKSESLFLQRKNLAELPGRSCSGVCTRRVSLRFVFRNHSSSTTLHSSCLHPYRKSPRSVPAVPSSPSVLLSVFLSTFLRKSVPSAQKLVRQPAPRISRMERLRRLRLRARRRLRRPRAPVLLLAVERYQSRVQRVLHPKSRPNPVKRREIVVLVYSSGFFYFQLQPGLVGQNKEVRNCCWKCDKDLVSNRRDLGWSSQALEDSKACWLKFVNSIPGMWPLKLSYGWVGRK